MKAAAVVGGAAAIGSFLKDSIGEAREAQKVGAQTNAVLKSTGRAAHVSAKQVGNLATAISNKVGIDDEAIQSGANLLLTFTNVRNEAGRGNKVFNQTIRTATDMSVALGTDAKSAAMQLGKALNDPTKGMTRLTRSGVTFTAEQVAQVKAMQASGNILGAQKLILHEVNREFGGSAAAAATAGDKFQVAFGNLKEQIGTALLPVLDRAANTMTTKVVPSVSKFITQMQDGTGAGGEFVDQLKQAVGVGRDIVAFFNGLPGPVKKYGLELLVAGVALNKVNNAARGLVSSLTPAEGAMTRTQKAAYGLGVGLRNAAGAGGMLLLADGAKKSYSALSALEVTAGAAATGFAVGGPLGAGVGALAGAFYGLYKAATDTKETFSSSLPTMKQYVGTLDGMSAATGRATRALVLERLEKAGTLKATQALNISDRDAVQAAMGNEAARRRVSAALAQAVAQGKNYQALKIANKLGAETTAINSSRVAQLQKNLALAGTRAEAERIQAKLDKLGRTNANPRITLGLGDTLSKLNAVQATIKELTGKQHVISIKQHVTGGLGPLLGAGPSGGRVAGADGLSASAQRMGEAISAGLGKGLKKNLAILKRREQQLTDQQQSLMERIGSVTVSSIQDTIDSLKSAMADLSSSISGNFKSDVFGGNLATLRAGLTADTTKAQSFASALQTAVGNGLTGDFYQSLAQSGNVALAQQVAALSSADLADLMGAFNARNAAANAIGDRVAQQFYGPKIDAQVVALQAAQASLASVDASLQNVQQQINAVEAAINKHAAKGKASATSGAATTKVKAKSKPRRG